jgi:hypothetical protein
MRALFACALAAAALSSVGCDNVRQCAPGTIYLELTLEGAAASATSIDLTITVDGRTATRTVTRTGGDSTETIELRFPAGYPEGKTIRIDARANGVAGSTSMTASTDCARFSIRLSTPAGAADLAAPADLSTPAEDLAVESDLAATVDLASEVDLAMPADMRWPVDMAPIVDMTPILDMTRPVD